MVTSFGIYLRHPNRSLFDGLGPFLSPPLLWTSKSGLRGCGSLITRNGLEENPLEEDESPRKARIYNFLELAIATKKI